MNEQFLTTQSSDQGKVCTCNCHKILCSCDCHKNTFSYEHMRKFPHCCPVCGGAGKLSNANTGTTTAGFPTNTCHGCVGTGIVWG